jgi:hypothetical protein
MSSPDPSWMFDEDIPPPAPETQPETQPVLLSRPGYSLVWVRAPTGDYVATGEREVYQALETWHPNVSLLRQSSRGPRRATVTELFEAVGRRIDSIVYTYTEEPGYHYDAHLGGGELVQRCARLDPLVKPAPDDEVSEWLSRLFGLQVEKCLDWLATVTDLRHPTAALYLEGDRNVGKGLLASSIGRMWGRGVTAFGDVVGARFNDGLLRSPIVFLDEGAGKVEAGSAAFRTIISESQHRIEEKHRPTATLRGCVRLVIAANNSDALRIREDLNERDEAAIGQRILHVDVGSDAGEFLRVMGGRHGRLGDWLETPEGLPGRVPRHIAHLAATRRVTPGGRFLVEGDAGGWLRKVGARPGLPQQVLVAIARMVDGLEYPEHGGPVVWPRGETCYVSANGLHKAWRDILGAAAAPPAESIGRALAVISGGPPVKLPRALATASGGPRCWVSAVPSIHVLEAACRLGIGEDIDRLERRLGGPASDPTAENNGGPGGPPPVRVYPDHINRGSSEEV